MNQPKHTSQIIDFELIKNNISIHNNINRDHILKVSRPFFDISYEHFTSLLTLSGNNAIAKRGFMHNFIIDDDNKFVVKCLYHYITGNQEKFMINESTPGNIYKGIILIGSFGTGKTILLEAFINLYDYFIKSIPGLSYHHQPSKFINNQKLEQIIKEDSLKNYAKCTLMIDDIGRESKDLKHFGNILLPMVQLLELRYINRSLTFATSNYKHETFKNFYTEYISERMIELFNYIELTGKSRRK